MYYLICAIVTSCLVFWFIQKKEEKERRTSDTSKQGMVFFFLLIVTTALFYFISNAWSTGENDGDAGMRAESGRKNNYMLEMVKNIREDVTVGMPPFGVAHGSGGDE